MSFRKIEIFNEMYTPVVWFILYIEFKKDRDL